MIKIITVGVLLAMALTTAACRTPESKIPDTVILEQKDSSDALTDETSPLTGIRMASLSRIIPTGSAV